MAVGGVVAVRYFCHLAVYFLYGGALFDCYEGFGAFLTGIESDGK